MNQALSLLIQKPSSLNKFKPFAIFQNFGKKSQQYVENLKKQSKTSLRIEVGQSALNFDATPIRDDDDSLISKSFINYAQKSEQYDEQAKKEILEQRKLKKQDSFYRKPAKNSLLYQTPKLSSLAFKEHSSNYLSIPLSQTYHQEHPRPDSGVPLKALEHSKEFLVVPINQSIIQNQSLPKDFDKLPYRKQLASVNPEQTVLHISNLPEEWNESQLYKYFDPQSDKLLDIKFIRNRLGIKTKSAFFTFRSREQADYFLKRYDNDWINTEDVQSNISVRQVKRKGHKDKLQIEHANRQIEVYNIPFEATEMDIYNIFKEFGTIERIQMPKKTQNTKQNRDRGKNKGFCLITYTFDSESKIASVKTEELRLFGREIKVKTKDFQFVTTKKRYGNKRSLDVLDDAGTGQYDVRGTFIQGFKDYEERQKRALENEFYGRVFN